MSITGVLGFLYCISEGPYISELTLARNVHDKNGWSVDDITWIIRIISMVVIHWRISDMVEVYSKVINLWGQNKCQK